MTCWADQADRQRQADEADEATYAEELQARALALMEPGKSHDPALPANIEIAAIELDDAPDEHMLFEFWYERAESQAEVDMQLDKDEY